VKISDVLSVPVRVPLERPASISTREVTGREYVLVWVDTDEGQTGLGYTYAGTVGGRATHDLIQNALRPKLIGEDPRLIERHWQTTYQETLLVGRRGATVRAISAVDIALWDLLGKVAKSAAVSTARRPRG